MGSLKDYFRPEFLNRLDEIILFNILTPDAIKDIVKIQVKIVEDRLQAKGITLNILPEAFEYIAKEGYNPQYGARPLKRLIQNKILTKVASSIISQDLSEGGEIDLIWGEFIFFIKEL